MESLPSHIQRDSIRPHSGSKYLWLATIAVPSTPTQRIAQNTEEVTYNGNTFKPESMEVGSQPRSGDGALPEIVLQVSALNEVLYEIIRSAQGALGAPVQLIKVNDQLLDSSVAALEADFELLQSKADDEWIYFTLGTINPAHQRYPLRDYSSSICPWAHPDHFKGVRCQYSGGDTTCTGTLEDCYTKTNQVHWGGEIGMDEIGMQL